MSLGYLTLKEKNKTFAMHPAEEQLEIQFSAIRILYKNKSQHYI